MKCVALLLLVVLAPLASTANAATLFDDDPAHPWNRLYAALQGDAREQNPFKPGRRYFFPSDVQYRELVAALDAFIRRRAEKMIGAPVQRAVLQSLVWATFDQASDPAAPEQSRRDEVTRRCAIIIRRLALTRAQIAALPDNYAAAVRNGTFFPWEPDRLASHSLTGLFWFCWPAGLAAWWLYVRWLEQPTFLLLPPRWRAGFTPSDRDFNFRSLTLASAAVIVGAITHDAWDSFTHRNSPVVHAIPALRSLLFEFEGVPVRTYRLLQHSSSALGLLILMLWAAARCRAGAASSKREEPLDISSRFRVFALLLMSAAACALAAVGYARNAGFRLEYMLFYVAVGGISGWFIGWCSVAAILQLRLRAFEKEG